MNRHDSRLAASERGGAATAVRARRFLVHILSVIALPLSALVSGAEEHILRPGEEYGGLLKTLKAGDIVRFLPGEHWGTIHLVELHGTAENPITIQGQGDVLIHPSSRETVWCALSSHIIIEGLRLAGATRAGVVLHKVEHVTIRDCVMMSNGVWGAQSTLSQHVTIENCELHGSIKEHGVYLSTTDHAIVRNCRIHNNAACGIHLNGDVGEGGDGIVTGSRLEGNHIYGNGKVGGAAINMDGTTGSMIRGNTIYDNLAGGIAVFVQNGRESGGGNQIIDNTIRFRPDEGRYGIRILNTPNGVAITNNAVIMGRGPVVEADGESIKAVRSDKNRFWRPTPRRAFRVGRRTFSLEQWRRKTGQDGSSSWQ